MREEITSLTEFRKHMDRLWELHTLDKVDLYHWKDDKKRYGESSRTLSRIGWFRGR